MESPWRFAVRLGFTVAIAVVVAQALAVRAQAVTPGKNGLLLIGASPGTRFSTTGNAASQAHVADCYPGPPDALWTVRPNGSHLQAVGPGSRGQFSPGGRTLMIADFEPCASAASLSLSIAPFRTERSIRGAVGGGAGNASLGSWLGPERPSVFDDSGRYLDALTQRPLLPGAGYSDAAGGAPPQASCDGRVAVYGSPTPSSLTIDTPVRAGRRLIAARRRVVALRAPGDYIDAQWSSDGRYLFYILHRSRVDTSSLWRVRSDGAGRRLLYTDRFNSDLGATVSPNGRWVLLQVLVGANQELWVIGSDGRAPHALAVAADGADLTTTAAWSPRGDRLFVVEDRTSVGPPPYSLPGSTTRVAFVIRPDGTARRSVHYPTSASGQVLWSPDERDLAYGVDASVVIAPLSGATSRTVLTANSPPTLGATGPATLDWQAVPGTGLPFSCLDGRRNRAELSAGRG